MSLQALCGSPWFLTSAVLVTTSMAMLYRRVVISYGRAQSFRAAFFILVCFGLMLVFNFPFRLRHSIYDITEGKTSGPWRPEWGSHKSTNTTSHTDDVSAYILSIAKKHNLPHDIPFFARRLQPKTSSSSGHLPPSLTTLKPPFLPSPHTFRNTSTTTPFPPPLPLPLNRPKSPPVDFSPLLLAISTTPSRFTSLSLPHTLSLFLAHTTSPHLLLLLHDATPADVSSAQATLSSLAIPATVTASTSSSPTGGRYAQLMQHLMHFRVRQMITPPPSPARWFALLNDDVFLPRPGALLRAMATLDANDEVLVTSPGRSPGAVFFTAGVLDVLGQLLCLQDAKKGENDGLGPEGWGGRLVECLGPAGVERRVLSAEGLDGGAGGLVMEGVEAGVEGYEVTEACGEGCWGQRWGFGDGWVVVGGVGVTEFLDGRVEVLPLAEKKEKVGGLVVLEEGGKREKGGGKRIQWEGRRRRTWRVLDSEVRKETGEVWQVYVRRKGRADLARDGGDDGEEMADRDSLVLLIWEREK